MADDPTSGDDAEQDNDGIGPPPNDAPDADQPGAPEETESYEGLAPPADEEAGEGAGTVDDAGEGDGGDPGTGEDGAEAGGVSGTTSGWGAAAGSGWLGSTAPVDVPPPPPPRRRGRAGLVVAVVVLLAGAAIGVVLALAGGSGPPAAAPSPSPAPSPSLLPPQSLAAQADPFDVTLTWDQPDGTPAVETYDVYRNDSLVDEVPGSSTSYHDSTVTPGKTYTYKLEAKAGTLVTGPISVKVSTPKPPLSEARLEGDFNVKLTVVSSSGFRSIQSKSTAGWHFKPRCKTGPCKVVMSDLSEKSLKLTLDRKGVKYSGDDPSVIFGSCSGKAIPSSSTVALTVTKAKGLTGKWVATRFTGTISFDTPSQLGCVRASATLSLTGSLLG